MAENQKSTAMDQNQDNFKQTRVRNVQLKFFSLPVQFDASASDSDDEVIRQNYKILNM